MHLLVSFGVNVHVNAFISALPIIFTILFSYSLLHLIVFLLMVHRLKNSSPHQHAEANMLELVEMLAQEEAGLTTDRSLDGTSLSCLYIGSNVLSNPYIYLSTHHMS